MYLLNVSLSKWKCIKCCSVRMRVCLIRICVVFLLWTASVGDAPKCSIFVCYTCHWACLRMRGGWCIPSAHAVACVVQGGRAPVGTSDPLRQRHGKVNRTWDTSSAKVMLTCHLAAHILLFVLFIVIHKCTLSIVCVLCTF